MRSITTLASVEGLPFAPVFWLGGGSGAGKTTVARALAGRIDLRVYHVDAHGFDHVRRMAQGPFPRTQVFNAKSLDDRWLREPAVLADEFLAISRERMPLIIEDLHAMGPGPTVVVEGPQLLPALITGLIDRPEAALWLLPTSQFGRQGVAARDEALGSTKEAEAAANRYQRDVLVTQILAEQAAKLGLRRVTVDGGRSVDQTVEWLRQSLLGAPGLLRRAEHGEERAQIRCQENQVMVGQLGAYWRDVGFATMPTPPEGPFSCECMMLGCEIELVLSADEYLLRREAGPFLVHSD